jgi:RNA polymerase sigma-70 factor (ECF subfamily)
MDTAVDEHILLTQLRSGGRQSELAYVQLLDRYQDRVYWHVRRMVHYHEDADDVVQNTFVKVWKGLSRFEGAASLYTWIYRIATNEAISLLRKRNKQVDTNSNQEMLHENIAADKYFDGDRAEVVLKAAITTLPDRQKAVFVMRYYEDLPYAEIAEITEVSVGSLKASYHHAMNKIKDYINTHA